MKFIQVFNRYLNPGGEENSVQRIAAHLERGGHTVTRFWRSSEEWNRPGAPSRLRQPFLLWRNAAVLRQLSDLHASEKPDAWILHNVVPVISLGIYRLARERRVPVFQWLHNYRPISVGGALKAGNRMLAPNDPWLAWKETWAGSWRGRFLTGWLALGYARTRRRGDFDCVRAWIAVSDAMKEMFARAALPADRLFTLRHSWDVEDAAPSLADEGHFLFLGRMIEAKGVRFLLELWRDPALAEIPLVMAGEGPLREELSRGAPPSVRWTGYVKGAEKRLLVAGCRAILFPCLWAEPLSTVAYEGYAQGKPILSSALGGMNELIRDGETGRLLEPANAAAWRAAILEFARDPSLSRRLGLNGRRWLDENVSPAAWNRGFSEIVEQALRG
jgi:glycosyltransferase involved in cell wall biosynthesis